MLAILMLILYLTLLTVNLTSVNLTEAQGTYLEVALGTYLVVLSLLIILEHVLKLVWMLRTGGMVYQSAVSVL